MTHLAQNQFPFGLLSGRSARGRSALLLLTFLGLSAALPRLRAANSASDNAANYAAWINGANGGSGFGPWQITRGTATNFFLASSVNNGTAPSGGIDTAGKSFGMLDVNAFGSSISRNFTGGSLTVGQTFTVDMDNGLVDPAGSVRFFLGNTNSVLFQFRFSGGGTNYLINDAGGARNTGVPFTDDGLRIAVTLTDSNKYSAAITSLAGLGTTFMTGTFSFDASGIGANQFGFTDIAAGATPESQLFFNNIGVVPEPRAVALLALGALGLVGLCARRRN
jgi:hypothetical protein